MGFRVFADPGTAAKVRCAPDEMRMNAVKIMTAALVLLACGAGVAPAQTATDFPSRPVKLLVPFAAGGPTDVVARILADFLSARWGGQSVVI